ncbi:hypothetical protein E2C01_090190 [Portunus trituberculatus]|uniref:Transposase IS30-like HTH domain-containing protein n=1 Tax=Portunus trituberculatus TaxID=210409 RepID=A0A5B7JPH9_PORTR|nr:hypothetical protein [Portunus trituberculatus]
MRSRHVYHETGLGERLWFTWLWAGGLSFRAIAKRAGRSPTTVRRWVKYLVKEEHRARTETRLLSDQRPSALSHYISMSNYLQRRLLYWLYVDNTFPVCDPLLPYRSRLEDKNLLTSSMNAYYLGRHCKASSALQ